MLKLAVGSILFILFSSLGILVISNSFSKFDIDLMEISSVIGKEPVALTKFTSVGTGTQTSYESSNLYYFEDLTPTDCSAITTALSEKRRVAVKSCDPVKEELVISFNTVFMNVIDP